MDFIDQAICAGRHKNAVAGISSVTSKDNTDGSVTFTILWKTGQTTKSTFKPPRGKGIKSTNIKKVTKKDANGKDVDEYHLIVTYDDNKTQDAGIIAGSGIEIVDDYTKLSTTLTDYTICYVLNDYTDTTVTPNEEYSKGFYLYDKVSKVWGPISASGKIASNTTLGNVIIKKDGGIEVDNNGNIWIGGYTKTETIDPITGDKTTVTTFNGVTDTKIETPTGDVSEKVDVGGLPFGSSSDIITNPDGSTTETITETVGGQTTTTVINKDASGNETGSTTTTEVGGEVISTITNSTSTTTDASGNTIKVDSTETTTASGGSQISSTTTTTTPTGDVTKVDKVENKDPSGITKIETTTTDPTGSVSTDTTYDAPSDMFMDRNDSDKLLENMFNDFGW